MRPGRSTPAPRLCRAALFAAAVALGVASCAVGDRHVRLIAPAAPAPAEPSALEAAAPREPAARSTVVLAVLRDERDERDALGDLRNGWGMRVGRIQSDDPVLPWVRAALAAELAGVGLELAPEGASSASASDGTHLLVLWLALRRAFCPDEGRPGASGPGAEVELAAQVFRAEQRLVSRTFLGVVERSDAQAPEEALAAALQEALEALALELRHAARAP